MFMSAVMGAIPVLARSFEFVQGKKLLTASVDTWAILKSFQKCWQMRRPQQSLQIWGPRENNVQASSGVWERAAFQIPARMGLVLVALDASPGHCLEP